MAEMKYAEIPYVDRKVSRIFYGTAMTFFVSVKLLQKGKASYDKSTNKRRLQIRSDRNGNGRSFRRKSFH